MLYTYIYVFVAQRQIMYWESSLEMGCQRQIMYWEPSLDGMESFGVGDWAVGEGVTTQLPLWALGS